MATRRVVEHRPEATEFCSSASSGSSNSPPRRIRVADEIPIFRDALSRELRQHGLEVVATAVEHQGLPDVDVVICGIAQEHDWDVLETMTGQTQVVAVVPEPLRENKLRALKLGAAGVSARSAPLEDIVEVVHALERGYMFIDLDLLHDLCSQLDPTPSFELSTAERGWLESLAGGVKVAELANQNGHSERAMYRRIRRLYKRMGVTDLRQALMKAARFRLLD